MDHRDLGVTPVALRLLSQDLVVWRDRGGEVHAFADQCPHRGARLSLGRVVAGPKGDHLECPYHGWQFDSQAQCRLVPATPQRVPADSVRARQFTTRIAYGLIWVRLDGVSSSLPSLGPASTGRVQAELPGFDAESDLRLRKVSCGPYWVETSAPRIVENFLDMAHFGFVHEDWLGDREHTAQQGYQVMETVSGVVATQCHAWQPKSSVHAKGGAMVEYRYEVVSPYCAVLTKIPDAAQVAIADFKESIALWVCPVDPERSLVWFRIAMNDFNSPDAELRAFQETIFSQDKPILESQSPKRLPLDPRAEMHSAADQLSAAYRRYLKRMEVQFGTC
jgi:phenylpropionate dioxygenase-like ring-hydroxylating dioxygenase large terminal subunit